MTSGPLDGVTVVEFAGIGPAPFVAMLLADMGARVIRIDRVGGPSADYTPNPVLERSRESIAVNLKDDDGKAVVAAIIARADVVVEGFRPGVMERLGLGPAELLSVNTRLVYARITGWGQTGPLAGEVGHDITYTAITGALHSFGEADRPPVAPLNLVGDFGGAALHGAFGIACALLSAERSGVGQVVDANVVDGTNSLMALVHGLRAMDKWRDDRETNLLDGAAPYYRTYRCSDDRFVAVGCIERRFFAELLDVMELDPTLIDAHGNRGMWSSTTEILRARFAERTRDEWAAAATGRDACLAPVLDLAEAAGYPHAQARQNYLPIDGFDADHRQPRPAPRFSETPTAEPRPAPTPGASTRSILAEHGFDEATINRLITQRSVAMQGEDPT